MYSNLGHPFLNVPGQTYQSPKMKKKKNINQCCTRKLITETIYIENICVSAFACVCVCVLFNSRDSTTQYLTMTHKCMMHSRTVHTLTRLGNPTKCTPNILLCYMWRTARAWWNATTKLHIDFAKYLWLLRILIVSRTARTPLLIAIHCIMFYSDFNWLRMLIDLRVDIWNVIYIFSINKPITEMNIKSHCNDGALNRFKLR